MHPYVSEPQPNDSKSNHSLDPVTRQFVKEHARLIPLVLDNSQSLLARYPSTPILSLSYALADELARCQPHHGQTPRSAALDFCLVFHLQKRLVEEISAHPNISSL